MLLRAGAGALAGAGKLPRVHISTTMDALDDDDDDDGGVGDDLTAAAAAHDPRSPSLMPLQSAFLRMGSDLDRLEKASLAREKRAKQRIAEALKAADAKLQDALKEELGGVRAKLAALEERVDKLEKRGPAPSPAPTPAAAPPNGVGSPGNSGFLPPGVGYVGFGSVNGPGSPGFGSVGGYSSLGAGSLGGYSPAGAGSLGGYPQGFGAAGGYFPVGFGAAGGYPPPPPGGGAVGGYPLGVGGASEQGPALVAAARDGRLDALQALLAQGADPNARDAQGRTALHAAAQLNHEAGVRALVAAGARKDAADAHGRLPFDLASADAVRSLLCC